ncbi:MAG: orotate phosphoribosyltransferase [Clostridia bacterium]
MKKEIAKGLLEIGAVFLRPNEPFIWASGIKSPIYCDNRLALSYVVLREMIEEDLVKLIQAEYEGCEILMGTSTAGIPHAAICASKMNLPMGYVRSEAKSHGRNNRIEGKLEIGQKTVVVEDLISTGGSAIDVVNALKDSGANVMGIVSIFTYGLNSGIENMKNANIKCVSLINLDDIIEAALEIGKINKEDEKKLKQFRENPAEYSKLFDN